MAITSDGMFAYGEDSADLLQWLRQYQVLDHPVDRLAVSACRVCGHGVFTVVADYGGSGARRICVSCGEVAFVADSEDYWMDDGAGPVLCDCGGDSFEVAVSFTMYANGEDVRAVCVGVRCLADGMIGAPADWNIRDHPSLHLTDRI